MDKNTIILNWHILDIIESPAEASPTPVNPQITDADCDHVWTTCCENCHFKRCRCNRNLYGSLAICDKCDFIPDATEKADIKPPIDFDAIQKKYCEVGQTQDKVDASKQKDGYCAEENTPCTHAKKDKPCNCVAIDDMDTWKNIADEIETKIVGSSEQKTSFWKYVMNDNLKRLQEWSPFGVPPKPPLKLRVSGVYKDGQGEIEEIAKLEPYAENAIFISKTNKRYSDGGLRFMAGASRLGSIFNLIEEIQPENVLRPEEIPGIDSELISCRPTIQSELEALRKENAELLKDKEIYHNLFSIQIDGWRNNVKHNMDEIELLKKQYSELVEECKKPLKEKQMVEYCACPSDTETFFAEKGDYKYIGCINCHKPLNRTMVAVEGFFAEKPQGNPFKVGDEVLVHGFGIDQAGNNYCFNDKKLKIVKITGDTIQMDILFMPSWGSYAYFWFHYKQCEKVIS